ncbi:MAG: hypothetical protein R3E10_16485 [Gemmatimonadota bacterium]
MIGPGRLRRGISAGWLLGVVGLVACGGEPPAEEVPYFPPGPPVQDTLSSETLEGIDPGELGLTLPWTQGTLNRRPPPGAPSRTIDGIELASHQGFDRLVVSFRADAPDFPGYRLEYLTEAPTECAADPSEVAVATSGAAFLRLRISGARGHDDDGRSTVGPTTRKGSSANLVTLIRTCDFEGEVSWVFDLATAMPYRIIELEDPTRLVVDVQQPTA